MSADGARVAIVHGYFLGESGSEVYARELARALKARGCDVTLVCQEPDPAAAGFIDEAWDLSSDNREIERVWQGESGGPGACRLVRPDIGARILVYAPGAAFPRFEATPMQDADTAAIERYVSANTAALQTVFDRWPPEMVQANHLVLQPVVAARALEGSSTALITTFHGSELTFSLSQDPRLVPYAAEGLAASRAVVSLSEWSSERLRAFADENGVGLGDRLVDIPPGVDTSLFVPIEDRAAVLDDILGPVDGLDPQADDIVVYSGALRRTKGVDHALIAIARVLEERPRARLVLAGGGPHADIMHRTAARVAALDPTGCLGSRIHFLGHQPHSRLAPLMGVADVALVPSVIPEAFALVAIEAASAGAVPIACYHTGMRRPVDAISEHLGDPELKDLEKGPGLWRRLAAQIVRVLERYPTREQAFRESLHAFADANFSWRMCAEAYLRLLEPAGTEAG